MSESVFPLNIPDKEDHPDKTALLDGILAKYFETAAEVNKKTRALEELFLKYNSLTGGFQNSISSSETPLNNGFFFPEDEATYANFGDLVYSPTTTDKGALVFFIKKDAEYSKIRIDLNVETDEIPVPGSTKLVKSGGIANAIEALGTSVKQPTNVLNFDKNKYFTYDNVQDSKKFTLSETDNKTGISIVMQFGHSVQTEPTLDFDKGIITGSFNNNLDEGKSNYIVLTYTYGDFVDVIYIEGNSNTFIPPLEDVDLNEELGALLLAWNKDSTNIGNLTQDGTNASVWLDASTNGNNFSQVTIGKQPLLNANGLLFNGGDDNMRLPINLTNFEVFFIFNQVSWVENARLMGFEGSETIMIQQQGDSPETRVYSYINSQLVDLNVSEIGENKVFHAVINGADSSFNGNAFDIGGTANIDEIILANRDSEANGGNIIFKEIVITEILTNTQREKVLERLNFINQ